MKRNKAVEQENKSLEDRFSKHAVRAPKKKKVYTRPPKTLTKINESKTVEQGKTLNGLHEEYLAIDKEMKRLNRRKKKILKELNEKGFFSENAKKYYRKPFYIYVLELEDGNYYIGQTRNVDKRFKSHKQGKGSEWTRLHKPVKVVETRETRALLESEAAVIEDEVAVEYAITYCADHVRGGGYSQVKTKPQWPQEVLDSESMCSHI